MTPERWQQIDQVLQAALERDPSERAAFLVDACRGNDALRQEVESLLASQEQSDSFLKSPAFEDAAALLADQSGNSLLGRAIGPYQILARLGAGGMGEVFLAQDTRLGRKIALKLLPAFSTQDEERLRRFQQEARAASALNHPNIITIFEIIQVESLHLIATEYIEGQTLRQRLSKTSLKINELLDITIQVASALAAAHEAGIIHRDIKPENLMVRPDGYVKVLDFGLVKMSGKSNVITATETPTAAKISTNPGMVMGTVNYMSPEQARGLRVDPRTDIFSLGVVLYEMVAGRPPFAGETASDVISAILDKTPLSLARFAPDAPNEIQWIVTKALRKDRDERYQTIKEMLSDLKDLRAELETQARRDSVASQSEGNARSEKAVREDKTDQVIQTTAIESAHTTSSAEVILNEIKRHKAGTAIILSIVFVMIAGLAYAIYRVAARKNAVSLPVPTPKMTRLTMGNVGGDVIDGGVAISPDGKYVTFETAEAGNWRLWLRQVSTNSVQQILGPIAGKFMVATFSPDSEFIYYTATDPSNSEGALYQVPLLGGRPRKVLSKISGAVSFSPSGEQFVFVRKNAGTPGSALVIANSDGSGERRLATKDDSIFSNDPAWSPDGRVIACGTMPVDRSSHIVAGTVVGVSADDGTERSLTEKKWPNVFRVLWLKDGSGLIVGAAEQAIAEYAQTQLWLLTYPSGEVRRITNDLNRYGTKNLAMTADSSTIVTTQEDIYRQIWVIAPNEDASRARLISHGKADGFYGLGWMPDGHIVYTGQAGQNIDLWLMNRDGTENKQLTFDVYTESVPEVTPDGRYIFFISDRGGAHHLWRMNTDGSDARRMTEGEDPEWSFDCSPDSRWVLYHQEVARKPTLWKVAIEGGAATRLNDYEAFFPRFSPDGKWIAYATFDEQVKRDKLTIMPAFDGPPSSSFALPPHIVIDNPFEWGKWSPDSSALTYVVRSDGVDNVWAQPTVGGQPKQLTNFKSDHILSFAWSHDGRLALSRGNNTADIVLIRDFK